MQESGSALKGLKKPECDTYNIFMAPPERILPETVLNGNLSNTNNVLDGGIFFNICGGVIAVIAKP